MRAKRNMSDHNNEIIKDLSHKIESIISMYEGLKKERVKLEIKNLELINEIDNQKIKTKLLEEKINNLMIAKNLSVGGENSDEAKNKLLKLVREIDKCIALLNS